MADKETLRRAMLAAGRCDPAEAARQFTQAAELWPDRRKSLQAALLSQAFGQAAELARLCGWSGTVVLRDGAVMVEEDGVRLAAGADDRYFRKTGEPQAAPFADRLAQLGVQPKVIVDIGANVGEISLYLAARYPQARVIAFEPDPGNLVLLRANLALQPKAPANLEIVGEAVSDRAGEIRFTAGAGDLATTRVDENLERLAKRAEVSVISVPTDTLAGYAARLGFAEIDFLKVDTEGGEPLLAEAIRGGAPRIKTAYVEMSRYNAVAAYADLAAAFDAAGLQMLTRKFKQVRAPADWIAEMLQRGPATDAWFVRRDLLP